MIDWESVPSHRCDGGYFIPEEDVKKYGVSKETYLEQILKPQLKELVTKYEPSLIFSDGGEWDLTEEESGVREFLSWLYQESAVREKVVVNDRFYTGMPGCHGDYYSTEYRDKTVGGHPWEESRGIGKSYGYNRAERLEDYMTSQELIHELVAIVSRGGNFLLNIGPMADGSIPIHEEERLKELGKWMRECGTAIYETEPYSGSCEYPATEKEDQVYVFIDQAEKDKVQIPIDLNGRAEEVGILGVQEKCSFLFENGKLTVGIDETEKFFRRLERYGTNVICIKVRTDKS